MSVPSDVAIYLLNQKRVEISELEQEFGTEIAIVGDDSMLNIADYTIQRASKDKPEAEELFNVHKPSTDVKKKNEIHKNAAKTVIDTRNRKVRPRGGGQRHNKKKKGFWEKIVG